MAVTAFARQVDAFKLGLKGSRAEIMEAAARQEFARAQAQNRAELGYEPPFEQFVDGRKDAPLKSVRPGGTIVFLFGVGAALLTKATDEAIAEFLRTAPVGRPPKDPHPGLYKNSLALLVNGAQRDAGTEGTTIQFKASDEVSLTNLQPYARRIEKGWSPQAPNGVIERIAALIRRRYGRILTVRFSWDSYPGFAVGRTRRGGAVKTRADFKRATAYPTIRISVK